MKKPNSYAILAALAIAALQAPAARADDARPEATTEVRVTSDWPKTELIRHLGTSYGMGTVGGRAASITTFHLENVCRTPCVATLSTEGNYYVDAPGMQARGFELPSGSKALDLQVEGASSAPLVLSLYGAIIGGAVAIVGAAMWAIFGSGDGTLESRTNAQGAFEYYRQPANTSAYQVMTLAGAGVMVAGIAGLSLLPRTHVETREGVRLDARAPAPRNARFTGNGFTF